MVDGPMIRDTPYEFIRDGAESMFFRGMRERWFAGDDGRELPEMNGWRETVIKQDHWAFTDRRGPGQGFTEIRYYEILVWIMVRHGNYPPETTECLRAALLQNYKAKVFCGGRGPEQFCPRSRQWYEMFARATSKSSTGETMSGSSALQMCPDLTRMSLASISSRAA